MKGKRDLGIIVNDTAVGLTMIFGASELLEITYNIGHQIGPKIQEYAGKFVSEAIEFGFPGLYAVATVPLIYRTIKAIDRLQLKNHID